MQLPSEKRVTSRNALQHEQQSNNQDNQVHALKQELANRDWHFAAQTKLMAETLADLHRKLD
eukprot:8916350-Heterocapsa_arctica.AAC.1